MCFGVKCVYRPKNKSKRPCEDAAEAGKSVVIHREASSEPTWTERPLSQEEDITLKEAHTGIRTLIYGDMSFGLIKLKLNCLAMATAKTFRKKKREACETPTQLWSMWVAAS